MTEEPYWVRLHNEKREKREAEERLREEAKVNPQIRKDARKALEQLRLDHAAAFARERATNSPMDGNNPGAGGEFRGFGPPKFVDSKAMVDAWKEQDRLRWLADPEGQQKKLDFVKQLRASKAAERPGQGFSKAGNEFNFGD